MKVKELYDSPLKQVVGKMNLIDVKIYSDAEGEVQAVLLKYVPGQNGESEKKLPLPYCGQTEEELWS